MFCFYGQEAYGISAQEPGIKSGSPTLEGKVLTTRPLGWFQTEPGMDLLLNQPDF